MIETISNNKGMLFKQLSKDKHAKFKLIDARCAIKFHPRYPVIVERGTCVVWERVNG
jgi:hypothetical protein